MNKKSVLRICLVTLIAIFGAVALGATQTTEIVAGGTCNESKDCGSGICMIDETGIATAVGDKGICVPVGLSQNDNSIISVVMKDPHETVCGYDQHAVPTIWGYEACLDNHLNGWGLWKH